MFPPCNLQWLLTLESLFICSQIPKGRRSQASVRFLDSCVQHKQAEEEAANWDVSHPSHTKALEITPQEAFWETSKTTHTHIFDFLKNEFPRERAYMTVPAEHSNPSLATLSDNFAVWGWLQQDRAWIVDIYISLMEWYSQVLSLSSSKKYQKLRDSHRWKNAQIFQNMHITSTISVMYLKESRLFYKRNCGLPGRTESHCKISNRAKKHTSVKEKLGNKLIVIVITTSLSGVRKGHLFHTTIIYKTHSFD